MRDSGLWLDVLEMPGALERTLAADVDDCVAVLGDPAVRRVIATGNGAAFYVGFALALAALVIVLQFLDALSESGRILAHAGNGQGEVWRYISLRTPEIIARFLPYFDGQIWKLNRHTFGYKSIRELRSGVHAAAVSRGVKLRTAAMDDDVHLVIQQIGQIPTRAQREAAE